MANTGADLILGNCGNDCLLGQGGNDRLTGGLGAENFIFAGGKGVRAIGGTITDFRLAAGDRIDLTTIDANAVRGFDPAFEFIGGAAFHSVKGELRLELGTPLLRPISTATARPISPSRSAM